MPRKRRRDARFIRECFRELAPDLKRVRWIPIDGLHEEETAAVLRRSLAFVSLARLEGFGLPALEALASGCLVVGFHGGGGREYATTENGDWFEDWDLVGVARALVHAVRNAANMGRRIEAALRAGAHYDIATTREKLVQYWTRRVEVSS
jgi:glycosyltransferase involved in cell wall biosynthesis